MANPKEIKYAKSHEWVEFTSDGQAVIGLTDYAQKQLGDIVFVNLPCEGDEIGVGDTIGDVESVKAVSDIYSPIAGTVAEVNEELADAPAKINEAPFEAWILKLKDLGETEELMTYDEYEELCKEEE